MQVVHEARFYFLLIAAWGWPGETILLWQKYFDRKNYHDYSFSIDLSLVTFNWFLTAFVDSVPIEVCLICLT